MHLQKFLNILVQVTKICLLLTVAHCFWIWLTITLVFTQLPNSLID